MFQNVIGFICCFKYYFCFHHALQIWWINGSVFFTGRICQAMERHKCWSSTCCTNSKFLILRINFFVFWGGGGGGVGKGLHFQNLLRAQNFWYHFYFLPWHPGGNLPTLLWHFPKLVRGTCFPECSNFDSICSFSCRRAGTLLSLCNLLSYWTC